MTKDEVSAMNTHVYCVTHTHTHTHTHTQVKIGGTALTEDELRSIHKYTELLLQDDRYARMQTDAASIEDFLEALFLLGIAGGVCVFIPASRPCISAQRAPMLNIVVHDVCRSCETTSSVYMMRTV